MTLRLPRGANSQDIQLMHLQDVSAAPTIGDGDLLIFDEASETFIPLARAYGSMYADDVAQTMTVGAANTEVKVTGGLTGGLCSGFTFQNSRELLCSVGGTYWVSWGMSISDPVNNHNLSGGVVVNTSSWQHQTEGSGNQNNSNNPIHVGGAGIITLSAGDVVGLFVENESAGNNITMRHASFALWRLGA